MLSLRPPGLEFQIMCLVGNVISFISASSGESPGPAICAQMWPKPNIYFILWATGDYLLVQFTVFNE